MSRRTLEFIIPGDLRSASGGYVYDRAMVAGLRARGWRVQVHSLDASFPSPTPAALAQAEQILADVPDGACVLIDGLALGAMPQLLQSHARRLAIVALIHMPLASEFGIAPAIARHRRREEQRALQLVRHVIVTSHNTARELAEEGVDPGRLSVVEPGVEQRLMERGPDRAAAIQMLCVATVQEGKGHELLIDVLAPLTHLPWHLQCVGSLSRTPTTVRRLIDQLRCLGLTERVTLAGELPHEALSAHYLAADLFVLPTLRESFCMAVAESLAHGLPVIATRTGAIPELVGSAAGLLTEPGDRDALHAALERALSDGALRSSLRAGALAASARLTPWPQACDRMAELLECVADGRVARYRMR
jgi:glycosyltransferase involved in cell wall biosynthesis